MKTGKLIAAGAGLMLLAGCQGASDATAALPKLEVAFADPAWTGGAVPEAGICTQQGGRGATPAMVVSGIPEGTAEIQVEFNDESYRPLSYDGGHGVVGYAHDGGATATLASVPGGVRALGVEGARVVKDTRATGVFDQPGYIGPCSNRRGNIYSAELTALGPDGKALATGAARLGRY